jgi:hypothetical protein
MGVRIARITATTIITRKNIPEPFESLSPPDLE